MASLAARLAYGADAKLLVVNCDDLGSSGSPTGQVVEAAGATLISFATLRDLHGAG